MEKFREHLTQNNPKLVEIYDEFQQKERTESPEKLIERIKEQIIATEEISRQKSEDLTKNWSHEGHGNQPNSTKIPDFARIRQEFKDAIIDNNDNFIKTMQLQLLKQALTEYLK